MAKLEGWLVVRPDGTVETDYFQHQSFNDKGQPVTAEQWRRKYRPACDMVRATLTWDVDGLPT